MDHHPDKRQLVLVVHSFDRLLSPHVRWLHEAWRRGPVHVLLLTDEAAERWESRRPEYPYAEREYLVSAFRFVQELSPCDARTPEELSTLLRRFPDPVLVNHPQLGIPLLPKIAKHIGVQCYTLTQEELNGFPELPERQPDPSKPRVIVTGCYDWLHSGHIRFFEEAASYGNLYVAVGNDANVRDLKGPAHPMFPQQERRYMVDCVKYVCKAVITSGSGWLDAKPEIEQIKPDIYIVNEDGDRPEKRRFCEEHGIRYIVLKRLPKPGLPPRQSTKLRGF